MPHLAPVVQKPHSWSPDFLLTRVQSICYTMVGITIWGEPDHAATWPKSSRDFPLGWEGDPSSSQGPIRPWRDLPSAITPTRPLCSPLQSLSTPCLVHPLPRPPSDGTRSSLCLDVSPVQTTLPTPTPLDSAFAVLSLAWPLCLRQSPLLFCLSDCSLLTSQHIIQVESFDHLFNYTLSACRWTETWFTDRSCHRGAPDWGSEPDPSSQPLTLSHRHSNRHRN